MRPVVKSEGRENRYYASSPVPITLKITQSCTHTRPTSSAFPHFLAWRPLIWVLFTMNFNGCLKLVPLILQRPGSYSPNSRCKPRDSPFHGPLTNFLQIGLVETGLYPPQGKSGLQDLVITRELLPSPFPMLMHMKITSPVGDILEIGALWSTRVKDIPSFDRYFSQLQVFYTDYRYGVVVTLILSDHSCRPVRFSPHRSENTLSGG